MKWLFWASAMWILYTYLGYAAWSKWKLWLWPRPVQRAPFEPSVSIVSRCMTPQAPVQDPRDALAGLQFAQTQENILERAHGEVGILFGAFAEAGPVFDLAGNRAMLQAADDLGVVDDGGREADGGSHGGDAKCAGMLHFATIISGAQKLKDPGSFATSGV